jgi:hypothetical protein
VSFIPCVLRDVPSLQTSSCEKSVNLNSKNFRKNVDSLEILSISTVSLRGMLILKSPNAEHLDPEDFRGTSASGMVEEIEDLLL